LSGAITNRFIILQTFNSWLDKEDTELEERLVEELPGILLWAIAGWKRLHARGRFVQTPGGARALREMAEHSAPVKGFIRQCCVLDPSAITPKADLYAAWRRWEDKTPEGEEHALHDGDRDDGTFAKALLAGFGDKVRETRPRDDDGGRVQSWSGVRLRDWLNDGVYADPL
jgi:phage/plasmid-associated DNA primase